MGNSLEGKIAVVAGGSRGIGLAIVERLLVDGATVFVGSRTIAEDFSKSNVTAYSLDVGKRNSVLEFVENVLKQVGKIDILVNSAGINKRFPAEDFSEADWDEVLNINLSGTYRMCQEIGRHMIANRSGKIVNITSMNSHITIPNVSAYAASKGAVMQYTKALAVEWAKYGIHVNAVSPGFIATDINKKAREQPTYRDTILDKTPMQRFGTPEEVADTVAYLVSDHATFINGQIFVVDGGYLAGHPNVIAR